MLITHLGTHINGDGPKNKKVGKLGIKILNHVWGLWALPRTY